MPRFSLHTGFDQPPYFPFYTYTLSKAYLNDKAMNNTFLFSRLATSPEYLVVTYGIWSVRIDNVELPRLNETVMIGNTTVTPFVPRIQGNPFAVDPQSGVVTLVGTLVPGATKYNITIVAYDTRTQCVTAAGTFTGPCRATTSVCVYSSIRDLHMKTS